jgi:hypothetical protein
MKTINLTQGKFSLVDDEDYNYLNQWRWYAYKDHGTFYARRNSSCDESGKRKSILMHRLIIRVEKNLQVDHKDHNGLNNQKCNLRICTHAENQKNRTSTGKVKYLGVHYITQKRNNKIYIKITATISVNNKLIYLGLYKTIEDAARAYDEAAKKYHGEFANLNFK